jgi:hypothetical protein
MTTMTLLERGQTRTDAGRKEGDEEKAAGGSEDEDGER